MTGYMPKAQRTDWNTPEVVVDALKELWLDITLDPCSNPTSIVPAREVIMPPNDGLVGPWTDKSVYVNPPFDQMDLWMEKCVRESSRAYGIVLLAPSRTDTAAWHRTIPTANAVCFWRGRLKFIGAPAACPFPTAFIYWGRATTRFETSFGPYGLVLPIPKAVP